MPRRLFPPLMLLLASCTSSTAPYETPTRSVGTASFAPSIPTFEPSSATTGSVLRSNASIVRDFLDLSFSLESGTEIPLLTRFEGPISVQLTGRYPATASADLESLLARLRNEAGIDINRSQSGTPNILIEAIPRSEINRLVPNAACFVAPNVSGLSDYLKNGQNRRHSWSRMTVRKTMTIFVPSDASPQETRDCLHEEVSQAIGPLNDLYHLTDSVFNDDNVHATLTSFDMLILRAYYDPMLSNGMTRQEVAGRLPYILTRLNPAGRGLPSSSVSNVIAQWDASIKQALGNGVSDRERIRAAQRAVALVKAHRITDNRAAFSYFVLGRVTMGKNDRESRSAFETADRLYAGLPDSGIHRAFVATQLAAFALSEGRADQALQMVKPYLQIARDNENASLLATLMLLQAEALELKGASADARSVRLDSMGWARYGFGSEKAVQARIREIAALSPR